MSQVLDRARNGVDTQRVRHARRDQGPARARPLPVPRQQPLDRRRAQPQRRSRTSTAPARRTPPAPRPSSSTPASPPSCSAPTPAPNPAEVLLHALAACLTTSLVYVAAARGVTLTAVESTLEGDMDVRGALGLDDEVRNGFERIRVTFRIEGDAPPRSCSELVERAPGALCRLRHRLERRAGRRRRARREYARARPLEPRC